MLVFSCLVEKGICPEDTWAGGVAQSLYSLTLVVLRSMQGCHDATVSKHIQNKTEQNKEDTPEDAKFPGALLATPATTTPRWELVSGSACLEDTPGTSGTRSPRSRVSRAVTCFSRYPENRPSGLFVPRMGLRVDLRHAHVAGSPRRHFRCQDGH